MLILSTIVDKVSNDRELEARHYRDPEAWTHLIHTTCVQQGYLIKRFL